MLKEGREVVDGEFKLHVQMLVLMEQWLLGMLTIKEVKLKCR
jgi:hypothetical protein